MYRAYATSPHDVQATVKAVYHLSYHLPMSRARTAQVLAAWLREHAYWRDTEYSSWYLAPDIAVQGITGSGIGTSGAYALLRIPHLIERECVCVCVAPATGRSCCFACSPSPEQRFETIQRGTAVSKAVLPVPSPQLMLRRAAAGHAPLLAPTERSLLALDMLCLCCLMTN